MAFFSKSGSAAARMQADLDTLRARRADLAAQLDQATAMITAHTETLHSALIGDASPAETATAETKLSDTERHRAALVSALSKIDATIAEIAEQIADADRRRVAQEQADAIDSLYAESAAKLDAFAAVAADLAPVIEKLGEKLFAAKRLAVIARAVATEFPVAKNGLADEARWTRDMILQRSEKPARAA